MTPPATQAGSLGRPAQPGSLASPTRSSTKTAAWWATDRSPRRGGARARRRPRRRQPGNRCVRDEGRVADEARRALGGQPLGRDGELARHDPPPRRQRLRRLLRVAEVPDDLGRVVGRVPDGVSGERQDADGEDTRGRCDRPEPPAEGAGALAGRAHASRHHIAHTTITSRPYGSTVRWQFQGWRSSAPTARMSRVQPRSVISRRRVPPRRRAMRAMPAMAVAFTARAPRLMPTGMPPVSR